MDSDELHSPFQSYSPLNSPFSQDILFTLSPISRQPLEMMDILPLSKPPLEINSEPLFSPIELIQPAKSPPKRSIQKLEFNEKIKKQRIRLNSMSIELALTYEETKPKIELPVKREAPSSQVSCNCQRTRCLKRYCECLTVGAFCSNCKCIGCLNNQENITLRDKAVQRILRKNPNAFSTDPCTTKSCKCHRSKCLKKYCECFFAGVKCSKKCKCTGCKNN